MSYKIAIFSLNQWSSDFVGNAVRIINSIEKARDVGAMYRAGPELELTGYSLDDAFFETDTIYHSWRCLKDIMQSTKRIEMIIDIGMPVQFGSLYNCRVSLYRGRILCIRAKTSLAKEGIYREFRHFEPWPKDAGTVPFKLPSYVTDGKPVYVPFGTNFILDIEKADQPGSSLKIGWEICQELWDVKNASDDLYHNFGCHLVVNSSGSYWELRKQELVNDMIKGLTAKCGACYAYSNLIGCDGQRNVFNGRSCIYDNGRLVAITPTDSVGLFEEIQMVTYYINPSDIDANRALRGVRPNVSKSSGRIWNLQDEANEVYKTDHGIFYIKIDKQQKSNTVDSLPYSLDINPKIRFEKEIFHFVSLWLWDYLRRSKMRGFMIPLSGGLDSSTVAVLVYSMCNHLKDLYDNENVQDYFYNVHNITVDSLRDRLSSPEALCKMLLRCSYLSTNYSSEATESRARNLSSAIGAEYTCISIQDIYERCREKGPKVNPKSSGVSLMEQNLQARLRMVMTYHLSEGSRIVLATGNVDEAIMGYLTKYDCSSADINPIGGLCKEDLRSFLQFSRQELFASNTKLVEILGEIIDAPPSAELTGSEQRDELEMGLTYDEISVLGKVRRGMYGCSGPRGAFEVVWRNRDKPPFSTKIRCLRATETYRTHGVIAAELGELIKIFYGRYMRNRHKLTVLTPALHAETYSPDDNRYDHRQLLYPPMSGYQFDCINQLVREISNNDGGLE